MKIEKISESQIKIILSKAEIKEKKIDIRGMLNGSSKAKAALNEVVYEAIEQVGLELDQNSFISLNVPYADEDSVELELNILDLNSKSELEAIQTVTNLLRTLGYADDMTEEELEECEEEVKRHLKYSKNSTNSSVKVPSTKNKSPVKSTSATKMNAKPIIYTFENMEYLSKIAKIFLNNKITFSESKVYKKDSKYFLVLTKKNTTKIDRAETILSEFGSKINYHECVLEEHGNLLIKEDAINILNTYF